MRDKSKGQPINTLFSTRLLVGFAQYLKKDGYLMYPQMIFLTMITRENPYIRKICPLNKWFIQKLTMIDILQTLHVMLNCILF